MGIEPILALQGEGREGCVRSSLCAPYTCLPQLGGIVMQHAREIGRAEDTTGAIDGIGG